MTSQEKNVRRGTDWYGDAAAGLIAAAYIPVGKP
jgi:hypothetical protein